MSSLPSFLLPQIFAHLQELSSFSFFTIWLLRISRNSFLPGNDAANELARIGALLFSSAVSLLLPLVFTLFFSRTGGVMPHLNSLTHWPPQCSLKNLCSLATLAVSLLAFAKTYIAFCQTLNFLELVESRIFYAAPAVIRSRNPLISFCTVQLRTLCTARSFATLCLFTTFGPSPGSFPASGASRSSQCPHPSEGIG